MKPIQKTISTGDIRDLIYQYLEHRTSVYFMQSHHGDDKWKIDGDIDITDLAGWISAEVSPCPCDCDTEEFTGRWTSGDFSTGPLTSAYTCEEHSALVAAWCHLGTGLEPVWVPAPAGDWRSMVYLTNPSVPAELLPTTTEKEVTK